MQKVSTQELASLLNGFDADDRFTRSVVKLAKDSGLIIISALGNDTVILSGAVTDEFDLLHGGQIFISNDNNECMPYTKNNADKTRKQIEVFWEEHSYYKWKFLTLIKHSTYDLKKGGKPFCKGIIFSVTSI
jgi:hypothetical protein